MSKSTEMKINDDGDFEKEQEEPCLLTTKTKCKGGGVVNNAR